MQMGETAMADPVDRQEVTPSEQGSTTTVALRDLEFRPHLETDIRHQNGA